MNVLCSGFGVFEVYGEVTAAFISCISILTCTWD